MAIRTDHRFKILCICGGGYLGLYPAEILKALEAYGQQRRRVGADVPVLHEQFDLIGGTSVGGLIALGIAHGVPAHRIATALRDHGPRIFPRPLGCNPVNWGKTVWRKARSLVSPAYGTQPLQDALTQVLGGDPKLSSVKTRAFVPAVGLADGKPTVFRAIPGVAAHRDKAGDELTSQQVLLATAAAPTYFAAKEVGGTLYADGGLVANAPDMIAYTEAISLGVAAEDVHILAVGTTAAPVGMPQAAGGSFGTMSWVRKKRVLKVAMNAQMELAREQVRTLLGGAHAGARYEIIDFLQGPDATATVGPDVATDGATRESDGMVGTTVQQDGFKRAMVNWINR